MSAATEHLAAILEARLSPEGWSWLSGKLAALSAAEDDTARRRATFLAFSGARRRAGTARLELSETERATATAARAGWQPERWSADEAARALILARLSESCAANELVPILDTIFESADISELEAGYKALPLLAHPEAHAARCAEGLRTNITTVFEAVAHGNPYPSEQLDEGAWNQMVLKALFVGTTLHPIQGLEARANPALARMLCDYAHERWAAGRRVSPELWRCVAAHPDEAGLDDLDRALSSDDALESRGAILALAACAAPEAAELKAKAGEPEDGLSWAALAAEYQKGH